MYGLHSLQGHFSGFHFLISLLKAFAVSSCFNTPGAITQNLEPRIEMLSVPLKTLRTYRVANLAGLRKS